MTTIKDSSAIRIKRALISVSDKTGIVDFAKKLASYDIEILSTGGTAKALKDAGLSVKDVSDETGHPEIMNGRVKTLHPKIHGGILADRGNDDHVKAMLDNDIHGIDMVVINLYPFVNTIQSGADFDTCIENIDIGGPAMIRAAAKNHAHVAVVTDPQDYELVLGNMHINNGGLSAKTRKQLATTAFSLTATYDANIAGWMVAQNDEEFGTPRRMSVSGTRLATLRYGENPHQTAALYKDDTDNRIGAGTATQLQGKELSYNNLNDTDAAFNLVSEFTDKPTVAIIKHANPCGIAGADTVAEAYRNALICDPVSAFGGIIAINRALDVDTAVLITETFSEVIIAPKINSDALEFLKTKKNLRVLETGEMPHGETGRKEIKRISGALLVQDIDTRSVTKDDLNIVSDREPTADEVRDMLFAFTVAKHVKSNAIVYAKDGATVGIGAGQMNRRDSARIAAMKAQEAAEMEGLKVSLAKGSVVASDAFFPFADGLIAAAEAGVTAVIQPGGSIRDEDVIAAANERGLAMAFTGVRHFKH